MDLMPGVGGGETGAAGSEDQEETDRAARARRRAAARSRIEEEMEEEDEDEENDNGDGHNRRRGETKICYLYSKLLIDTLFWSPVLAEKNTVTCSQSCVTQKVINFDAKASTNFDTWDVVLWKRVQTLLSVTFWAPLQLHEVPKPLCHW